MRISKAGLIYFLPDFRRSDRLAAGVIAFVLLVGAELAVAYFLDARSPSQYISSRDPVSGTVYMISLFFFAVAPALWNSRPGPDKLVKPKPLRGSAYFRR